MVVTAGTRLGPYEILGPLGAGGMGEVYRARDTRLGREAAVKLLLAEAASDPERRQRFEQEARSASALNHPNIVTVYDIGSEDGTTYIAMELVEGRTLRELITDGALQTRKLLDLAVQIADGLARAHEAGIVHRDLKPENVMVTRDNFVKILDFGLAKLAEVPAQDVSAMATMAAAPPTQPGTVLGTAGYMSPEQASGQTLDYRSDQFSLGAILYEMATGKRAFQRKTGAETLVAIIREEPEPIGQVNPRAPAPVRWIVERCLAKDAEERYASTKDLARELRSVRDHLSETSASESIAAVSPPRLRLPAWLVTTAALLAGIAIGIVLLRAVEQSRPTSPSRFQRLTFRRGMIVNACFAPDGRSVVYGAAWDGLPVEMYSTRPENPESRTLGIRPASVLSVSSTGELAVLLGWRPVFGWESTGTLARVPLDGGAPREILENVWGADWSPDGRELAVVHETGSERRLEYPIGKVLHRTNGWISNPRISADGKLIAFVDHPHRGDNVGSVVIVDLAGKKIATGPTQPITGLAWSHAGEEVWFSGAGFSALRPSGKVRDVARLLGWAVLLDISRDGRVLLSRSNRRREMFGLAPGETAERNLSWLDWSVPSAISDDGRAVLFDEQNVGPQYLAYYRKTDGSPAVLLGHGSSSALSPDGKLALVAAEIRPQQLTLLPTGAGQPQTLPKTGITYERAHFFPDGKRLLVAGNEPERGVRLYVQDLAGGKLAPITPEGVATLPGNVLSPDGKTVAALGPERKILLYPTDPGEPRAAPGLLAEEIPIRWTPDGRALWVSRPNEVPAKIVRVDMTTGERSPWKELIPPDPAGVLLIGPIVMTPDGKSYAYSYRRNLDELFFAEGIR